MSSRVRQTFRNSLLPELLRQLPNTPTARWVKHHLPRVPVGSVVMAVSGQRLVQQLQRLIPYVQQLAW